MADTKITLFEWFVSSEVTGVVTWVGTIFGLLGLTYAIKQTSDAKIAANDAKSASDAVLEANSEIQKRLYSASVSRVQVEIDQMLMYLERGSLDAARAMCSSIKRSFNYFFSSVDVSTNIGVLDLDSAKKSWESVENYIDRMKSSDIDKNISKIRLECSKVQRFLSDAEGRSVFSFAKG